MPPKHGWRQPSLAHPHVIENRNVPGGVGYGYYFDDNALLWTNCSIADYYVVAPSSLGETVSFLYLTSTCRAQLGTESLVAYETNDEAQFWIFDWSQADANPWQVMINLPTDNPQYLALRPNESGVTNQMVHVRNGTFLLGYSNGNYNWENQTLLFDFNRGGWDFVYSYDYTTAELTDNIPVAGGESVGFWGPIVETFETYPQINPVGFDLIRLFQDGNCNPSWLTPANSYSFQISYNGGPPDNAWNLLTEAPNTSFTVCVGTNSGPAGMDNVGTLCVTVNTNIASFSLNPPAGLISPYWIITPSSNRWDKTVVGLPAGTYAIAFRALPGLSAPAGQVFRITANNVTTVQAYETNMPISITSCFFSGTNFVVCWQSVPGGIYNVLTNADLVLPHTWGLAGGPITATDTNTCFTLPCGIKASAHLFLQIQQIQ